MTKRGAWPITGRAPSTRLRRACAILVEQLAARVRPSATRSRRRSRRRRRRGAGLLRGCRRRARARARRGRSVLDSADSRQSVLRAAGRGAGLSSARRAFGAAAESVARAVTGYPAGIRSGGRFSPRLKRARRAHAEAALQPEYVFGMHHLEQREIQHVALIEQPVDSRAEVLEVMTLRGWFGRRSSWIALASRRSRTSPATKPSSSAWNNGKKSCATVCPRRCANTAWRTCGPELERARQGDADRAAQLEHIFGVHHLQRVKFNAL